MKRTIALAVWTALMASMGAVPAAQYFGRNKVQYETFDFRILQTPHFDIYYYPEEREATEYAARMAERWYERLSHALDHEFRQRQPIVLYASHSHFVQTTVIPGHLSEGVGGVTEHQKGRVVLPFAAGLGETDHVLGHELVHAFQRDILRQRNRSIMSLPLWFVEGMAEYLSVGTLDSNTAMWLRDAAADRRLPSIEELDDPAWFPYRYGQALWSYLAGRFGEDVAARSLKSMAAGGAVGRIVAVTAVDVHTLSREWHQAIAETLGAVQPAPAAAARSTAVISQERGGRLNVGPALSPDGREIVFLSERDQYSIDVYLADASSGAIKRRLVQTAADPHFDSLQFIGSSGAWDPSGRQFVLAAVHRGQPVLTILDMRTGSVRREIVLDDLDEVFGPAWSPDGRQLVFSGLSKGFSDLYAVEIESGTLRALTDDPFADLQPSWSPDGRNIVFATDRFSSSLTSLRFGNYRLGTLDVLSGQVRELPGIDAAKHIDPSWSSDGGSVYFVADRDGRNNVYRLEVATGELFQVTNMESGVSGVTALSPALSVAHASDRFAFSVYRHGGYEIHVDEAGDGRPLARGQAKGGERPAAVTQMVSAARPPTFGPVDDQQFPTRPYKRGLTFDGIGQPYLSAGGGSLGSFVRAGISLTFGDMLGEQSLQTAVQFGKGVDDFALRMGYVNRRSRWNWGVMGGQLPATLGASRTSLASPSTTSGGAAAITTEDVVFRQIHRQVSATTAYPFSRARRFEVTAGLHDVTHDRRVTTTVYRTGTGEVVGETRDRTTAGSVVLVETGAALVHDSTLSGPTSPILGSRYRFEIAPTFGGLTAATVLADYRRYFMPRRPLTVALRLKHLGRFGPGAGDPRLLPLTYNLRDIVRAYDGGALTSRACGDDSTADCVALRHLATRHLFAGNVELRFPAIGVFQGNATYGPLPLEGFVFSDTGWIWSVPLVTETAAGGTWLSSLGAGVRVNTAGFVFELAAGRPLAMVVDGGWRLAVNFRPGF